MNPTHPIKGTDMNPVVEQLLARSNRLGSDPRNTNYAGGNTSAKGIEVDPVTGDDVELMWVKGSGGDLGTLTAGGLAVLRLDRLRALVDVYPGEEREDEMVAAFDYCLHGKGGAAPSIDTAMHGLVDAAHVDHLHPDSGIAIATAADGEQLTKRIYGDKVVWVPWRRPGFELGLDIAAIRDRAPRRGRRHPRRSRHHGVGRDERRGGGEQPLDHRTAQAYLDEHGDRRAVRRRRRRAPPARARPNAERRRRRSPHTCAPSHHRTSRWSGTSTDCDRVLEFLASEKLFDLAALGTSCPDHFLRTKVKPLVLDLPSTASIEESTARLAELHERTGRTTAAYYERHAPRTPRRCAAPTRRSSSCRASACSPTAGTSRRHASPASSTSTPST